MAWLILGLIITALAGYTGWRSLRQARQEKGPLTRWQAVRAFLAGCLGFPVALAIFLVLFCLFWDFFLNDPEDPETLEAVREWLS